MPNGNSSWCRICSCYRTPPLPTLEGGVGKTSVLWRRKLDLEAKSVFLGGQEEEGDLGRMSGSLLSLLHYPRRVVPAGGLRSPAHRVRSDGAGVSACTCVYVKCTCEMWRRPPRRSCMLGKNMNNQHIAHTSAESWEGAGRSRGLSPAGWREAGTTRKRGGHFRVALQLSFASTELRNRKKGEWEEVIFILFLFKGLILHAKCGVLKVED